MLRNAHEGFKHSRADQEYLDGCTARQLMDFRNDVFAAGFIERNPQLFLNYDWVDVPQLRAFLRQNTPDSGFDASTTRPSAIHDPPNIKIEPLAPSGPTGPRGLIKAEPLAISLPPPSAIKMRTVKENGCDVLVILSDSESESDIDDRDSDLEVIEALKHTSRSSSVIPPSGIEVLMFSYSAKYLLEAPDVESDFEEPGTVISSHSHDDADGVDLLDSDTAWPDGAEAHVRIGRFRPTARITVERMEYREGPAPLYPIHRIRTGIVVDLSADKYQLRDSKGELYSLNSIINNADNDSWVWDGGSNSGAAVTFAPGEAPIRSRRIRFRCKGIDACDKHDPSLRQAVRFELDSAPRDAIIAAQQETRRREGNTAEERVVLFMKIIRKAKCHAVDSKGNKCRGGPVLKPKPQGTSRGHQYFVGCSSWNPGFKTGHRTHAIPDHVDENMLTNTLAGRPLADDETKDTPACSGIVHPHTGLKKKHCLHAHIANGMQVQGAIRNYPCSAVRYIYIPDDSSIRKVLLIHNETGHNHPIPMLSKVSFELKETYRQCVDANGVLGATVAKIDNAPATKQLLKGKTPAAYAPALHNQRVKQDIVRAKKLEMYPNGLGIDAIRPMFYEELRKSLPERYIHGYIETDQGELIIVTFVPYLLKLLDDPGVTSFDGDTTFKGIEGEVNEWELTIFAKVVQRAVSVVRTYITGASTDFFERLYDELQRVKLMVTGKPLGLKKFVEGGNLLVMNVDMDVKQIIGACRSILKYNNPAYSGIPMNTRPQDIAADFIKICWRHGKEPVHDFRALVSAEDFGRLMDFVYLESVEKLEAYTSFVYGLKIPQITIAVTSLGRARNSQRQSAVARKSHESREVADLTKQLQLQIDAEAEKRRASNSATKALKEQIKAAKGATGGRGKAGNLSASSSGRVKMRRTRAVSGPSTTSVPMQAEDAPAVETSPMQSSAPFPLALTASITAPRNGSAASESRFTPALITPQFNFDPAQPMVDASMLDLLGNFGVNPFSDGIETSYSDVNASPLWDNLGGLDFTAHTGGVDQRTHHGFISDPLTHDAGAYVDYAASFFAPDTLGGTSLDEFFDPVIYGSFGASIPAAVVNDPLQAFLDSFQDGAADLSLGGSGLNSATLSAIPSLPPPPTTPSPSPPTERVEQCPIAPRSRRQRQEVDEANIVTTTRARAPSSRKRDAEEELASRPAKKRVRQPTTRLERDITNMYRVCVQTRHIPGTRLVNHLVPNAHIFGWPISGLQIQSGLKQIPPRTVLAGGMIHHLLCGEQSRDVSGTHPQNMAMIYHTRAVTISVGLPRGNINVEGKGELVVVNGILRVCRCLAKSLEAGSRGTHP
ncbi:hypothetical protein B0H10DRAFT_1964125 [Mycena sp. CBHHK59/15]|nr:hypothetical protein B0H10DRAFT_1964125 [Mycena sp. CBHHK59/15]